MAVLYLETGAVFSDADDAEVLDVLMFGTAKEGAQWDAFGAEVLAECILQLPGYRPWAW